MSRSLIPKEMLSAYQRWEMTSFHEDEPAPESVDIPAPPPCLLPSSETIANIHEAARLSGHATGMSEGHLEGHAAGFAEGCDAVALEIKNLRQIAENFGTEVARADELIAQDLLNLALDIAKAMLKNSLQIRPELVLPIVSEAIGYLPAVQRPAKLIVNPEDAVIIKKHMENELSQAGWLILDDSRQERGGCCIETPSNEINASATSRWQRIASALGKEGDWLAP